MVTDLHTPPVFLPESPTVVRPCVPRFPAGIVPPARPPRPARRGRAASAGTAGRHYRIADMFCGAGGATEAAELAVDDLGATCQTDAINHDLPAVTSHSYNHPTVRHWCESVSAVPPRVAVPEGRLNLLLAGPSCTEHTYAKGNRKINEQKRMPIWQVLRWMDPSELTVDNLLLENVPALTKFGPCYPDDHPDPKKAGRPIVAQRGKFFDNIVRNLRCFGYWVDYRVLNSADYGDPQTRKRLWLVARRRQRRFAWPAPTHAEHPEGEADLFGRQLLPWRGVNEVIDWSNLGESIFTRRQRGLKPLVENTLRRIAAGMRKFNGLDLQAFIVQANGTADDQLAHSVRSVREPAATITGGGTHLNLATPFLVAHFGERDGQEPRTLSVDRPAATVTSQGAGSLVRPFLMPFEGVYPGGNHARGLETPAPTVTSRGIGHLISPRLLDMECGGLPWTPGGDGPDAPQIVGRVAAGPMAGRPIVRVDGHDYALDILFRGLTLRECASAQGFREDYRFFGTKGQQQTQIGNSWPINTARALVRELLS